MTCRTDKWMPKDVGSESEACGFTAGYAVPCWAPAMDAWKDVDDAEQCERSFVCATNPEGFVPACTPELVLQTMWDDGTTRWDIAVMPTATLWDSET